MATGARGAAFEVRLRVNASPDCWASLVAPASRQLSRACGSRDPAARELLATGGWTRSPVSHRPRGRRSAVAARGDTLQGESAGGRETRADGEQSLRKRYLGRRDLLRSEIDRHHRRIGESEKAGRQAVGGPSEPGLRRKRIPRQSALRRNRGCEVLPDDSRRSRRCRHGDRQPPGEFRTGRRSPVRREGRQGGGHLQRGRRTTSASWDPTASESST
jgi:hypothetical protein